MCVYGESASSLYAELEVICAMLDAMSWLVTCSGIADCILLIVDYIMVTVLKL